MYCSLQLVAKWHDPSSNNWVSNWVKTKQKKTQLSFSTCNLDGYEIHLYTHGNAASISLNPLTGSPKSWQWVQFSTWWPSTEWQGRQQLINVSWKFTIHWGWWSSAKTSQHKKKSEQGCGRLKVNWITVLSTKCPCSHVTAHNMKKFDALYQQMSQ